MLTLAIVFDAPYWVALLEERTGTSVQVARWLFGSEPGHAEVAEFVRYAAVELLDALEPVDTPVAAIATRRINPKRLAREAAAQLRDDGWLTAANEALKAQQEQARQERVVSNREQRRAEAARRRALAVHKARERKRGH